MRLRTKGVQMLDEALGQIGAKNAAQQQATQSAQERYLATILGALPESDRLNALLANPNYQQAGKFTIPPHVVTDDERLKQQQTAYALSGFDDPKSLGAGGAESLRYQLMSGGHAAPTDVTQWNIARDTYADPKAVPVEMLTRQRTADKLDPTGGEKLTVAETNRHNTAEEGQTAPLRVAQTKEAMSLVGLHGAETQNEILKRDPNSPLSPRHGAMGGTDDDVKMTAQGIIDGKQPPTLNGLRGDTIKVRAELQRQGYDLAKAEQDWHATQKYLSTLNGSGQIRLRQAVDFTYHSLDVVEGLAQEWNSHGLPILSKANLAAARSGAYGQDAQSLATRLDGQIGDLVSELAVVYKGGNSPTDEGLKLAAKNLQGDWSFKALSDNVGLVRQNLQIRRNSMSNVTATANVGNQYAPSLTGGSADTGAGVGAQPTKRRVYDPKTGTFSDK